MTNSEELFDVVDAEDRVLEQLPRSVVHARKLLHRAANVFVFNSRGELLLQYRAAIKDEYPLTYTSSASGHLSAGEDYAESAQREMQEEIGIETPLERLEKFPGTPHNAYEHTVLFRTFSDGPFTFDPGEIERANFFALEEIDQMLAENAEQFTPPFRQLYRWYRVRHRD
ncbi:putative Nudix hydrolase YfcD [Gimesia panareensis]|uniref:Putative Nudix hydrolase YfcD n=1 Tax=Gimesia panareensis TaxID=2527978 RepID=A0A517Q5L2_9PLAN|nr:NUDIX domain-containing protein [Gimesia panareensis]QDT26920.1 putative Nudix hydrolase YfcD [Gimesia panareensis]